MNADGIALLSWASLPPEFVEPPVRSTKTMYYEPANQRLLRALNRDVLRDHHKTAEGDTTEQSRMGSW